ncbi:MAG: hypothetical protein NVSMB18_21250 [Acetobacteraceae bacterium]
MSNALLSDVEARAERRRLRTSAEMWQGLARAAWDRSQQEQARGDLAEARRWLERARRLAPQDGLVRSALAGLLLAQGEAAEAASHFQVLAERYRDPEFWTGLAACRLRLDEPELARDAAQRALQSSVPVAALRAVAAAVVDRLGLPGWCGLDGDGRVYTGPATPSVLRLDGKAVRGARLPRGWQAGRALIAEGPAGAFLGSPLPVDAIVAVEGFVEPHAGGLRGWAWHPADRDRDPRLVVQGAAHSVALTPREPDDAVQAGPLARPRRFALSAAEVRALGEPLAILAATGRHVLGSPFDPSLELRAAASSAAFRPVWADVVGDGAAPAGLDPPRLVDVVIPVHRGRRETLACLESVLASVPEATRIHVVEDASPEPDLVAALVELADAGRIHLIRQTLNRGFPATANAGLRACPGRDAVLLNSDTLVAPGWLERLRRAAYAAPEIGTVTPLSNDATILSYPDPGGGNSVPDLAETLAMDGLAQRANPGAVADLPVGVGFCLYVRRDCLDQVGLFREDLFAQGYGEENDLCLRARHHGWRNVAALDVFVGHVGGRSFGAARDHLIRRNTALLNRLHPGYDALVAAHLAADPLAPARRAMDALRWAEGRATAGSALLVTHGGGGGVEQVVAARCAALRAEGLRPIVLRPGRGGCRVETPGEGFPNLVYAVPDELPALAALLRPDRPRHFELHHLLGHQHAILDLARRLRLPVDAYVHDYAWFCPRIALVSRDRRYCGEPEIVGCEDCIADLGGLLEEEIAVAALVARSAADLGACRRVVAPSRDAATRLQRHFPGIRPEVQPWGDDSRLPPLDPAPSGVTTRVCVVGAIGVEKGFEVLLSCVRDAARRRLPLEFVVCGYTADDERLLAAGPVFITGEYKDAEAEALIRSQRAQLGFIPSIWPETWCFALSRAWQAGLPVAAFDLGAPAERIRATGRGCLLPLGLSARAVNDALLSLAPQPCAPKPAVAMSAAPTNPLIE